MMQDPRTTITGLVTGIAGLLAYFNIAIPEGWMMPIVLVGTIVLGFLAKDKKKEN